MSTQPKSLIDQILDDARSLSSKIKELDAGMMEAASLLNEMVKAFGEDTQRNGVTIPSSRHIEVWKMQVEAWTKEYSRSEPKSH